MTTRQLTALLAMPASLRPILFTGSAAPSLRPQIRCLHATCQAYARYMKKPLSVGAFTVPHSPMLPLSDISINELLESPVPGKSLADELRRLFTHNPATFYHGTSDFYMLKKNTRVPEICILGRSNVGKSTFVNALANRQQNELAHTSARAGRTKAMNAFGFGPAPTLKELAEADPEAKRTEDIPKHQFFVVDMPGYGHKSLQDWGKHITLYLNKRQAIKGAVLLIDGEVGPKNGDLMALELLQAAGVKTAIVLTKADKARHVEALKSTCKEMWTTMRDIHARDPNSRWEWEKDFFVTALGATKKEIGAETVAIARLAVARLGGLVKEKERSETEPAKGYAGNIISFDDLQLASSKSTQMPSATRPVRLTAPPAIQGMNPPFSGFTALEQAAMEQHRVRTAVGRPSHDMSTPRQSRQPASRPAAQATRRLRRSTSRHTTPAIRQPRSPVSRPTTVATKSPSSALDSLERAAGDRHRTRSAFNRPSNTSPGWSGAANPRHPKAHFIHTSHSSYSQTRGLKTLSEQAPLTSRELQDVLREFAASLDPSPNLLDRANKADRDRARNRAKDKIWDPTFSRLSKEQRERNKAKREQHLMIYEARLQREEMRGHLGEERKKQREMEEQLAGKHAIRKLRGDMRNQSEGNEDMAQSWEQIEEAQDREYKALRGRKLKKAKRDEEKRAIREEKQKRQRKEHLVTGDDIDEVD